MTFDDLMTRWTWRPIRNCPGRYRLVGVDPGFSLQDVLGRDTRGYSFRTAKARDLVLVVSLDQGGVISYQRADGRFVHTLNTPQGFSRKLAQLEIVLPRVEGQSEDMPSQPEGTPPPAG